jgi:hypothetical protein
MSVSQAPAAALRAGEIRMPEPKTRPTRLVARTWLAGIADEARRKDCARLIALMKHATGEPPVLWGGSIVGFGSYLARYASGKSLDWPLVAFAARGTGLVLYVMPGFAGSKTLLQRLGPHRTGKSCLYVKRLADLDLEVLAALLEGSVQAMRAKHATRPAKAAARA